MQAHIENTIKNTAQASNEGRIHFGEVVQALLSAGVEAYAVDYRACRITYYLPNDETLTLEQTAPETAIADAFSTETIVAAIRGAQSGKVMYPEFKRLSQSGGCIGYTVWLQGRHVSYYGRKGEVHIERFPD